MTHDFSRKPDQDLTALYRRLSGDTTAQTMADECRRMAALDAAGQEILRRGLSLP